MSPTCRECKSEMIEGVTNVILWRDGVSIEIQNVPAQVCSVCGEAYIHVDVAEELDQLADAMVERRPRLEKIIGEIIPRARYPLRGLKVAWS